MTATDEATQVASPSERGRSRRVVTWIMVVVVSLLLLVPAAALARVVTASRSTDLVHTDVIVVLGASQFWGRPSPVLQARLDRAAHLHAEGVAPVVITVGGKQPGDRTTEAEAGRQSLIASGVPSSQVLAVPVGRDTMTSMTAVAHVMAAHGWTSATIVTDPAHEARSLAMARALGIDAHGAPTLAGPGSGLTFDYLVRETGGLLWFWLAERRGVPTVVAG